MKEALIKSYIEQIRKMKQSGATWTKTITGWHRNYNKVDVALRIEELQGTIEELANEH